MGIKIVAVKIGEKVVKQMAERIGENWYLVETVSSIRKIFEPIS